MTRPHRLSTAQVLRRARAAAGLSFAAAFTWLAAAAVLLLPSGPGTDERLLQRSFVAMAVVATGGCAVAAATRIRTIQRVFATGRVVEGRVAAPGEEVEHVPAAEVAYSYDGHEYRLSSHTVLALRAPAPGETVQVVVDPERPERAFVVKPYTG